MQKITGARNLRFVGRGNGSRIGGSCADRGFCSGGRGSGGGEGQSSGVGHVDVFLNK